MKASFEWDEQDLLDLIEIGARESNVLEFKSCAALGKGKGLEVAKDVSAFANAGGGTIVYGVIENRDTHTAERLDQGYDPNDISELWLEQVIDSNIQQRLENVVIRPISLDQTSPGKVAYVVWVPASNRAPHMVNHRYHKRRNFSVVEMEEDEVRDRYRREAFPGKEIVEAWRDDVVNPLISLLEHENTTLQAEKWDWNHYYEKFVVLTKIADPSEFSANKEDFVERHSQVGELLLEHDMLVDAVNGAGKELFERVSKSSFIREIFAATTSEDSLEAVRVANVNAFSSKNGAEVYQELFGNDRNDQERLNYFTEWIMNGFSPANARPFVAFWTAARFRFRTLIEDPPLIEYRLRAEAARGQLREFNIRVISAVKQLRKKLSERHRIPVEGSRLASQHFPDWSDYGRSRLS